MLEKIQRRAARWVAGCFDKHSSVPTILCSLGWPAFAQRRKISQLSLFHKIIYNSSVLSLPSYYLKTERSTLHHHPSTSFNHIPILQHINIASFHNPLKIGIVYPFH